MSVFFSIYLAVLSVLLLVAVRYSWLTFAAGHSQDAVIAVPYYKRRLHLSVVVFAVGALVPPLWWYFQP